MILHYTIKFKGALNYTFEFSFNAYQAGIEDYVCQKSDGFLYIKGVKITNKPEAKQTIWKNLTYSASNYADDGYVDSEFSIDAYGNVICNNHYYGDNKADRLISKFMRFLGH